MIDSETRTAVLELHKRGFSKRKISRELELSRKTVRKIIRSGTSVVPNYQRDESFTAHTELIRELFLNCKGNLVRVLEELQDKMQQPELKYSTLTSFCRKIGLSSRKKKTSGEYTFQPGEEMQFDTSPHIVVIGGKKRKLQCAAIVLGYSRMIFVQIYEHFDRFMAKIFLTEAFKYFGGSAKKNVIDNTSVIVVSGTGENAIMSAEMEAFAKRYAFEFMAHGLGHADRKALVERTFDYIDVNFYPGRTFNSLEELNIGVVQWCDKANGKLKRSLQARPIDLFQTERHHLNPLPIHVPEVYQLHSRTVDPDGYVSLDTNRYSAPDSYIGRTINVRETKDKVKIMLGHQVLAEHTKLGYKARKSSRIPGHRKKGHWKRKQERAISPDEQTLRNASPTMEEFIKALNKQNARRRMSNIKRLFSLYLDYPKDTLVAAIQEALNHRLLDVKRVEKIVLRSIQGDFFNSAQMAKDREV